MCDNLHYHKVGNAITAKGLHWRYNTLQHAATCCNTL